MGIRFTTEATITSINIKRDWFYIACSKFAKKATEEDGMYRCLDHGMQAEPSYRYNFKAFITDPSATAPITFFTPGADDVTGYPCSELVAMHKAKDPQEIPPEIFAVEGQKNVFQIHFNETGKTTDFVLDQVFDKKKNHKSTATAIELHAGTPPTPLALTNKEYEEKKTSEETKPRPVKRQLFQDEEPSQKKQKAADPSTAEKARTKAAEKSNTARR